MEPKSKTCDKTDDGGKTPTSHKLATQISYLHKLATHIPHLRNLGLYSNKFRVQRYNILKSLIRLTNDRLHLRKSSRISIKSCKSSKVLTQWANSNKISAHVKDRHFTMYIKIRY